MNFYSGFAKERLLMKKDSVEFHSTQQTLLNVLQVILATISPITIYTAQDAFHNMPLELFGQSLKPKTVFEVPWPQNELSRMAPTHMLQNKEIKESFDTLLELRAQL